MAGLRPVSPVFRSIGMQRGRRGRSSLPPSYILPCFLASGLRIGRLLPSSAVRYLRIIRIKMPASCLRGRRSIRHIFSLSLSLFNLVIYFSPLLFVSRSSVFLLSSSAFNLHLLTGAPLHLGVATSSSLNGLFLCFSRSPFFLPVLLDSLR